MTDSPGQRALLVLALLGATLVLALVLLVAFEPDVQTIPADELVERRDDARAFLIADYFFILVYAVLSPIAIWRFRGADPAGAGARWIFLAAPFLVAAGVVDAVENTLLLTATGSESESTVDAAHALAVPKVALFVIGAVLALAVNVRAAKTLRAGR